MLIIPLLFSTKKKGNKEKNNTGLKELHTWLKLERREMLRHIILPHTLLFKLFMSHYCYKSPDQTFNRQIFPSFPNVLSLPLTG